MTQIATTLAGPVLAYLVLLAGLYTLTFGAFNPRARLAGVGGVLALAVALTGLQSLGASYAALALVAVGALLLIAEFHLPCRGALGLSGVAAFVLGSILLFDLDGGPRVVLAALALAGAAGQLRVICLAMRVRHPPAR